ncbi:2-alkyl-3-oxoalkanoate reductase [Colwellia psychrerythraea]|uniref:Sterol-4-alpha-carboxylate 3-dehydrogenase (Decarboxylating) n=1 Tax=Colwellia psychrerythraea TaxID=28229 RepID=A0A099KHW0_COLPS|nr:2-alkyl-3-oxoalkanoate reductase [Colwellia psychrerythraea]KGJ89850.1 Sterol-4-alpha-carboxylate 3-dehydrogenase (decarboxylating) [Colwellia psychrerythraea]
MIEQAKNSATATTVDFNEAIHLPLSELAAQSKHVFVTGAGGFLGKAICRLLRLANIKVTGFARGNYPELSQMGVTMEQGDITDLSRVKEAMQSCDLVFHVAAKAGVWGSKDDYFKPNVQGTENVIKACKELTISRLVYTSTPSVTFSGVDEAGIDESTPYANNFLNFYGESKAVAEQVVLAASRDSFDKTKLKTVALRPHLIWGPNDPHLVPRVLERARAGKLKLVGKQDKLVDTIFVDNAAYAHILAAIELSKSNSQCIGKAYFISNDQPITMAAMLNNILSCVELPPVTKRVPSAVAYAVGTALEWLYKLMNKKQEPIMTRFVAKQLSTCHYFDISAAKRDFGYTPLISIEDGMKQLKASLNR